MLVFQRLERYQFTLMVKKSVDYQILKNQRIENNYS